MKSPRSFELVASPHGIRTLAGFLLALLFLIILGLVYIPWQQTVVAVGSLIVLDPDERPQEIHATLQGRLERWHVKEGDRVEKGQRVLAIAEIDVRFLGEKQLERLAQQIIASRAQGQAMAEYVKAVERQIASMQEALDATLAAARAKLKQSLQKITQEEQSRLAAQQSLHASSINQERIQGLEKMGLRSRRDGELAEVSFVKDQAELQKGLASIEVASQGAEVARMELAEKESDVRSKIDKERATIASAQEKISSIEKEILKLEIEMENLRERIAQRELRAPCDGRIVRLLKRGAGETVKPGDVLAIIVPDAEAIAVELFVRDHDVPLLVAGSPVRLQFAGFPALQFSGWPQLSTGTFAGRVHVIDAVDDGEGKYRILVTPDQDSIGRGLEEPWPSLDRLRPGASTTGWVMLRTVSLGFELWRQFNAFPPIPVIEMGKEETGTTPSKLEGMAQKRLKK